MVHSSQQVLEKNQARNLAYVHKHFLSFDDLVMQSGHSEEKVRSLLTAQAAPGVIYAFDEEKGWWSALGVLLGKQEESPPDKGKKWYTPACIWWLRRAFLHMRQGEGPEKAAQSNARFFISDFARRLVQTPYAELAWPQCFKAGSPVSRIISETAQSEWNYWVQGTYGVCLRHFSAQTCLEKETLAARIRLHFEASEGDDMRLSDLSLFGLCERLATLLMPFAPWERAGGTPGKAIDRSLEYLKLGHDCPY